MLRLLSEPAMTRIVPNVSESHMSKNLVRDAGTRYAKKRPAVGS